MIKSILIISIFIFAHKILSQEKVFLEGEELNYVVSYGFIKLGEVKIDLLTRKIENDKVIYSARSTMKTYDGIPLISLNSVFESEMVYDGKEIYSKRFKAMEYKNDGLVTIEYKFNYDSDYVNVHKENKGKTERDENIKFNKDIKFQDGLSLFYKSRLSSFSSENFLIPVFMNEKETSVNYYFSSVNDEISISLFKNDINTKKCDGVANFTGVLGLSGEFAGWFSNDEARIPVKSQMNVVIGNITLELDSYKRTGWAPGKK